MWHEKGRLGLGRTTWKWQHRFTRHKPIIIIITNRLCALLRYETCAKGSRRDKAHNSKVEAHHIGRHFFPPVLVLSSSSEKILYMDLYVYIYILYNANLVFQTKTKRFLVCKCIYCFKYFNFFRTWDAAKSLKKFLIDKRSHGIYMRLYTYITERYPNLLDSVNMDRWNLFHVYEPD